MRRPFSSTAGASRRERLEVFADSKLGRLLEPLANVVDRSSQSSLVYENVRVLTYAFAYLLAEDVEGDYAEFGVWKGLTLRQAWQAARKNGGAQRHFWAFDSFEGLPEVVGSDATGRFKTGGFPTDRRSVESLLRRAGLPPEQLHVVEGFFDETLTGPEPPPLEQVAVAWVDCDLYSSTVPVLDFLTPRLSQGAILLFDDWFCFKGDPDRGEAKACREWVERNPDITLIPWRQYNWAGQSFIVRRDDG